MVKIVWEVPPGAPPDWQAWEQALDLGPTEVNRVAAAQGRLLEDGSMEVVIRTEIGAGGWVPRSNPNAADRQAIRQRLSDAVAGSHTFRVRHAAELAEAILRLYSERRKNL